MALSPREEDALAAFEAAVRADDPAFAAALGAAPPPVARARRLPVRHLVHLVATLLALVAVAALYAEELGTGGTAAATAVLVLPWLVLTASFTADRRPRAARGRSSRRPLGAVEMGFVACAGTLLALLLAPVVWKAAVMLAVVLVAVPWLALRAMAWIDVDTSRRPSSTRD